MYICQYCGKECKNLNSLRQHEVRCKENPNRLNLEGHSKGHKGTNQFIRAKELGLEMPKVTNETRFKTSLSVKGKHLTKEQKQKISESMKLAHAEGRAHNIGQSRWNNEPSYPEKWFMEVIENEFENKNYIREFSFHKYSLDFAWPEIKKCIEIDGEQHERFEEYKQRDIVKDELLQSNGWKVLRISWSKCFHNPKEYIDIAKQFIHYN